MKLITDLGMLTSSGKAKTIARYGIYECEDCHEHIKANTYNVKKNNQKYCKSCSRRIVMTSHGLSKHPLHRVWSSMKQRCYNEKTDSYYFYGYRGIKVCDEWVNNFEKFYNWCIENKYKKGLEIDRIDSNRNYEPNNCRFTTRKIQTRNTRKLKRDNTSGYRCVRKSNSRWESYITVDYKSIYLGVFNTAALAAIAYDYYVDKNNLEHTKNFT